jgi:hypothetical protein
MNTKFDLKKKTIASRMAIKTTVKGEEGYLLANGRFVKCKGINTSGSIVSTVVGD